MKNSKVPLRKIFTHPPFWTIYKDNGAYYGITDTARGASIARKNGFVTLRHPSRKEYVIKEKMGKHIRMLE